MTLEMSDQQRLDLYREVRSVIYKVVGGGIAAILAVVWWFCRDLITDVREVKMEVVAVKKDVARHEEDILSAKAVVSDSLKNQTAMLIQLTRIEEAGKSQTTTVDRLAKFFMENVDWTARKPLLDYSQPIDRGKLP